MKSQLCSRTEISEGAPRKFDSASHFIEWSQFTGWKQWVRFTSALACADMWWKGILTCPPTPTWRTADHALTVVTLVLGWCYAYTTKPKQCVLQLHINFSLLSSYFSQSVLLTEKNLTAYCSYRWPSVTEISGCAFLSICLFNWKALIKKVTLMFPL